MEKGQRKQKKSPAQGNVTGHNHVRELGLLGTAWAGSHISVFSPL